ncbi:MAG: nicotinate (nicotinamide) nucleotide adenylyltransferase [Anaerolineales bacterium]|nr:nicotinate (nicotinamide) nucleotide adenylyltransferase [Anaerolineales bacterium]
MDLPAEARKIGVFGGTFDPPHVAHLILASEAQYQLGLDLILWVLTPNPPHKGGKSNGSLEDRLDLVNAAITENTAFKLSRVEIDRPGPHYAADTMHLLAKQYPYTELFYLMGGDSLRDLPTWDRPNVFLASCHGLGVMRRPGDNIDLAALECQLPGITQKVTFVEAPLLDISASLIRDAIRQGKPFRYFVPEAVNKLILERGMYKS